LHGLTFRDFVSKFISKESYAGRANRWASAEPSARSHNCRSRLWADRNRSRTRAVKPGGSGDITKDRLWHHPKPANQRVGSGMIVGDHVYMVEENGVPHCYDLKTGAEVWKVEKRPGSGPTWGSMVHAEGRLYVLMRNGETLVFAASPKYELLAPNSPGTGENTNSSLVISNGDLFIRTFKHLWRIAGNQ